MWSMKPGSGKKQGEMALGIIGFLVGSDHLSREQVGSLSAGKGSGMGHSSREFLAAHPHEAQALYDDSSRLPRVEMGIRRSPALCEHPKSRKSISAVYFSFARSTGPTPSPRTHTFLFCWFGDFVVELTPPLNTVCGS